MNMRMMGFCQFFFLKRVLRSLAPNEPRSGLLQKGQVGDCSKVKQFWEKMNIYVCLF